MQQSPSAGAGAPPGAPPGARPRPEVTVRSALPPSAEVAIALAAVLGVVLVLLDDRGIALWLPGATGLGC